MSCRMTMYRGSVQIGCGRPAAFIAEWWIKRDDGSLFRRKGAECRVHHNVIVKQGTPAWIEQETGKAPIYHPI